jgi:hypothetical protein
LDETLYGVRGLTTYIINNYYYLLQLGLVFGKQRITVRNNSKMLYLEHRIYLIQCWTGFRNIITKFNETFPSTYVITHGCAEAYKKVSKNWILLTN